MKVWLETKWIPIKSISSISVNSCVVNDGQSMIDIINTNKTGPSYKMPIEMRKIKYYLINNRTANQQVPK